MLKYPEVSIIIDKTNILLSGISYFIQKYGLSVLVGHQENINAIAQYLDLPYQVGNYPKYYVQGTSGFIFTLDTNSLTIEYLYLDTEGDFIISPCTVIKLPPPNFSVSLAPVRVSY